MNDEYISKLSQQEAINVCQLAADGKVVDGLFVGREQETRAILNRIEIASRDGGIGSAVFIVGENGKGKSKFLNYITTIARNDFDDVICSFEITKERFAGTGVRELYCRFINNLSVRTKPNGGALETLLQNFIMKVQKESDEKEQKQSLAEECKKEVLKSTEGTEINTAFAHVIGLYIDAVTKNDTKLRQYSLKWLKGEYQRVQDAHRDFGHEVDIIINDKYGIPMIKNWIRVFAYLGKTTILTIDEMQRLAKLDEQVAKRNWDVVKDLYDDSKGLKAVFLFAGTMELLDKYNKRGLFSNPDLSSRLGGKAFNTQGLADYTQSIIYLKAITNPYVLMDYLANLQKIKEVALGYGLDISEDDIKAFLSKEKKEREVYDPKNGNADNEVDVPLRILQKDFMRVLALMEYNPGKKFQEIAGLAIESKANDNPDKLDENPQIDVL